MLFGPEDRRIGGGVISAGNCPGNRVRHTIPLKDRVSNDSTLFFKGGERAAVCLIVLAWKASPKTRLAVAANRDGVFARRAPAAPRRAPAPPPPPRGAGGAARPAPPPGGAGPRGGWDVAGSHASGPV